jgi:hypothetical protein
MAISGAMPMQCTGCGEPLVTILERALEVCGACDFSRRYRAGRWATSRVAGVDPRGTARREEMAEKVRDRGERLRAS